jgi:proline iminopeptidase
MKKKKGAPVKSRATPRRAAIKRAATKRKSPQSAAKSMPRAVKTRETSRPSHRNATRRELYPALEPFRHGYLRVSEVHEIYYEECGNPAGKPAVFLHGGPGAGSDKRARQFFDPQHYRIVVFDQRGGGRKRPNGGRR